MFTPLWTHHKKSKNRNNQVYHKTHFWRRNQNIRKTLNRNWNRWNGDASRRKEDGCRKILAAMGKISRKILHRSSSFSASFFLLFTDVLLLLLRSSCFLLRCSSSSSSSSSSTSIFCSVLPHPIFFFFCSVLLLLFLLFTILVLNSIYKIRKCQKKNKESRLHGNLIKVIKW